MAVQQQRKSKSRRDMRRSQHDKTTAPNLTPCPNCNEPKLPHRVCSYCGFYRGREVKVIQTEE
ncbi:MAG: 50S ribosomal protein L32 [Polyangia bacterium]|jgi:large subunit ribosomal protein L32|nr:50S ribosomal protein L32 [Polyangia bacterium]